MLPSRPFDISSRSLDEVRQQLLDSIQQWMNSGATEAPLLLTPTSLGMWEAKAWSTLHTEILTQVLCDLLGALALPRISSAYKYCLLIDEEVRVFRCWRRRLDLYVRRTLEGSVVFYLVEMGG